MKQREKKSMLRLSQDLPSKVPPIEKNLGMKGKMNSCKDFLQNMISAKEMSFNDLLLY